MALANSLSSLTTIARRHFFRDCGVGVGKLALGGLLTDSLVRGAIAAEANPLVPRKSHFTGKAKSVIHLFMAGAPSQLDLFDNKPKLSEYEGKPIPPEVVGNQRYAFIRPDSNCLGPRFKFAKHGQSGTELSEMLPHLAKIVDDICLVKSVKTDQFNHAPAQIFFNTGFSQPGRPSLGSWVLYGLGAETSELPAFVVMSTGAGISGGAANWSSGFLPTVYTGVRLRNQGDPILNVSSPPGVDARLQRDTLDLIGSLNRKRLEADGDPEIATRIASYEMAFRLQTSAPELMDLRGESEATLKMYGCDPAQPSFARPPIRRSGGAVRRRPGWPGRRRCTLPPAGPAALAPLRCATKPQPYRRGQRCRPGWPQPRQRQRIPLRAEAAALRMLVPSGTVPRTLVTERKPPGRLAGHYADPTLPGSCEWPLPAPQRARPA